VFVLGSLQYEFGSSARIGPGYFPFVLGAITAILGVWVAFAREKAAEAEGTQTWRAVLSVLISVLLFAVLIEPVGFLPAVFVSVAVAAVGDATARPFGTFFLAACVTAGSWLVFSVGLRLPYDLFKVPL